MNRRGSVILHVLVTGMLVALIAAMILRVSTNSYIMTAHANADTIQTRAAEGALSRLSASWSVYGACTDTPDYNCGNPRPSSPTGGEVGTCSCTCNPASSSDPTVNASASASGACNLQIVAVDPLATNVGF
jgi:Tfp pilus assembly protein PilX